MAWGAVVLAATVLTTAPSAAAAQPYVDWDIYHTYSSAKNYAICPGGENETGVPLRYGNQRFGLVHIGERHGDFAEHASSATSYNLTYGEPTLVPRSTDLPYRAHQQCWPEDPTMSADFAGMVYVVGLEEWTAAADTRFPETSIAEPASFLI